MYSLVILDHTLDPLGFGRTHDESRRLRHLINDPVPLYWVSQLSLARPFVFRLVFVCRGATRLSSPAFSLRLRGRSAAVGGSILAGVRSDRRSKALSKPDDQTPPPHILSQLFEPPNSHLTFRWTMISLLPSQSRHAVTNFLRLSPMYVRRTIHGSPARRGGVFRNAEGRWSASTGTILGTLTIREIFALLSGLLTSEYAQTRLVHI